MTTNIYQVYNEKFDTYFHSVSGAPSAASDGKSLLILVSVLDPGGSGAETTVEKFKVSFMLFYPVLVLDPPLESP